MDQNFEVNSVSEAAQVIFDSAKARLLFHADVFWARALIGNEILELWLTTYQMSRNF